ncbi:hypothetical protein ACFWGP_05330 [Agromyces sp. NPDC127015]|uniref:hypothetical protein n=1 Tax=Agromyces sp. NPDC127015 TaxID=3347108 RepID=UPI003656F135
MVFDIRLRLYTPAGDKQRVLKTTSIGFNDPDGGSSSIRFTTSERVAGYLPAPFVVALEYSTGGGWAEARNGRFIVTEDAGDADEESKAVTFTGVNLIGWLLGRNLLHWTVSAKNGQRRWDDRSAGYIMNTFLVEAKNRGWGPYVSYDFTGSVDSNGAAWPAADKIDVEHRLLTSASKALDALVGAGLCEWWTQGLEFCMGVPGTGVDRTSGAGVVRLGPRTKSSKVRTSFDEVFTHLTVVPEKARYWLYLTNAGADTSFGRLEASQSQDGVEKHSVATRLAQPALKAGRVKQREASITYDAEGATYLPWVHYRAGDIIKARLKGGWENVRVVDLTLAKNGDGEITVSVALENRFKKLEAKLAKRTSNASVARAVGGASASPISSTGGPAMPRPAAPGGLTTVENVGWVGEDGLPRARAVVEWLPVTTAEDGSSVDIDQYEVWLSGTNPKRLTATEGVRAELELTAGILASVTVRAHSSSGWSEQSAPLIITPEMPYPPEPKPPTGLAIAENVGYFEARGRSRSRVRIVWDAVTEGVDDQPITLGGYDVWVAVNGGVPFQALATKGLEATFDLDPLVPVEFTVRAQAAVGLLAIGLWSQPSAALPVVPAQVVSAPEAPSDPVITTALGIAVAVWDGLVGGHAPVPGFAYVQAEFAREGTEDWAQFGPQLSQAGSVTLTGEQVGSTVRIRFRSVDTLGALSDPSLEASVVIGGVTGPDIEAGTITGNHIEVGTIGVTHLEPSVGASIDLTVNDSFVIIAGAVDETASALDDMQSVYRFTATEAVISAKDSTFELAMDNDSIEIREGGVPVSWWNSGQMFVDSLVGNTVVLGNHQLEKYGTGTVMRAL